MRGKVNLEYIADEGARKATYLRRKNGLLKKLKDLTILAGGIDACAVIYSEFHDQPEEWPSQSEVQRIITEFRSYPKWEQFKKMWNQESLLDEMIHKAEEKLAKLQRKNKAIQMSLRLFELMGNGNIVTTMSKEELDQIAWTIDENLKQVDQRFIELNKNASTSQSQAQVVDPTLVAHGEIAQVADPTFVADEAIAQVVDPTFVADGAIMQAETHVNHGQSDEMYKKATEDFTSFLKYINDEDSDSSA